MDFYTNLALCAHQHTGGHHVISPQDLGRSGLFADRREPLRVRPGASTDHADHDKRREQTDYEVETGMLAERRYIVCRNHQEAEKDAADRASMLAALERQLANHHR
jgi:hypothetical protein